ncbi:hypothetical protein DPMN_191451 [Dreissena polymorpha]|uniref:Uncharacterized protein n=1 Tax=Dreissena polymorpha TaxID=45954 RepID=A0A9D3Y1C5_DREPO|nr:hypothetical protein DPMN_191451 [Dreissena polymorpha]
MALQDSALQLHQLATLTETTIPTLQSVPLTKKMVEGLCTFTWAFPISNFGHQDIRTCIPKDFLERCSTLVFVALDGVFMEITTSMRIPSQILRSELTVQILLQYSARDRLFI